MKPYLLSFGAGVIVGGAWLALGGGLSSPPDKDVRTKQTEDQRQLAAQAEALRQKEYQSLEERVRVNNATPEEMPSPKKSRQYIDNFDQRCAGHAQTLTQLQEQSLAFREVADLAPVLSQAAMTNDQAQAAAIFLEWYRREPLKALEELEARPRLNAEPDTWNQTFLAAFAVVGADDIETYLKKNPALAGGRLGIVKHLIGALAEKDDLPALERMVTLSPRTAYFITESWRSKSPTADARTVASSPALRAQLLPSLFSLRYDCGSPELRAALLAQTWPGSEAAKAKWLEEWLPSGEAIDPRQLGREMVPGARLPDSETFPPLPNYPALVFRKQMTLAEVQADAEVRGVPGYGADSLLLADAEGAVAWELAHGKDRRELAQNCVTRLCFRSHDLNGDACHYARWLQGMTAIHEELTDTTLFMLFSPADQQEALRMWLATNPQVAGQALETVPAPWQVSLDSDTAPRWGGPRRTESR